MHKQNVDDARARRLLFSQKPRQHISLRAFESTRPWRSHAIHCRVRVNFRTSLLFPVAMATASHAGPVVVSRVSRVNAASSSRRMRPVARIEDSRNTTSRRAFSFHGRRTTSVTTCAQKQSYASFDDMIATSPVPVLVDFYATWCGPCQMLSKTVFPQVAAAIGKENVTLVKINTEKYPNIASKFKVEALPTIILFKNGVVADRIEGLPDATALTERLKYMLGASAAGK